ncbi:unnamed protein product [Fraxinus pennsylvanica]|uniref:Uncharacterized protein n=1 Tax=Fraxinus pennsylvanica TaxID=56036 RepID=A0AAD1Z1I5_9LAMI|nr:unnamed protein product [Fraxinus pennsylvanica]
MFRRSTHSGKLHCTWYDGGVQCGGGAAVLWWCCVLVVLGILVVLVGSGWCRFLYLALMTEGSFNGIGKLVMLNSLFIRVTTIMYYKQSSCLTMRTEALLPTHGCCWCNASGDGGG